MPLPGIFKKRHLADERIISKDHVPTPLIILHTDSHTEEIIQESAFPLSDNSSIFKIKTDTSKKKIKRLLSKLRPVVTDSPLTSSPLNKSKLKYPSLSRTRTQTSEKVPINLPDIEILADCVENGVEKKSKETRLQWEKRASILAKTNEESCQNLRALKKKSTNNLLSNDETDCRDSESKKLSPSIDGSGDDIQEAIRLHESGDLETSTLMFGRIAKSSGENKLLSQVLYGLSLRHGWGCAPDPAEAVKYLSVAAANAAAIEDSSFQTGKEHVGAARGELVLAIYELANCFRHGWGIPVDKVAAKQYYETAANLGDTDAMNEVARCYLEGFGCTKDKSIAAKYYRMAEQKGNKILGNTWIWKDKYDY